MATRIDYFDNPDAPEANSVVPAANVVVQDAQGRILMIRRSDNGNWAVPGGGMELGESLPSTAVREVLEETGITCKVTGLVGIYTDPRHVTHFTSNDEVRQEFSVVFTAEYVSGDPTASNETTDVHWIEPKEIEGLTMDRSMRLRISHFLEDSGKPHLE
ncbi:MAG TPA: NUDIX domain-containing protein [Actinocrinis sp.]|nr:NUDIX domain-containing protein [Actinocrinis sp.]